MKRILICLALAGSAFAEVRVVPPIPTNLTPVTLHFSGIEGCAFTYATGAAVERVGQVIRVRIALGGECILSVTDDWYIAVPVGALEPGNYEVLADAGRGFVKMAQFKVLDATTFPITPPGLLVSECFGYLLRAPMVFHDAQLRLGNAEAFVDDGGRMSVSDCAEPGLVDVEVTTPDGETFIARNGFTFYEGESGATHPYVYEDVLIPIYLNARGASGDWRTELAFRATELGRVVPFYAPWGRFEAGSERAVIAPVEVGNRGNGFFLRVARNGVERFLPELRVWNAAVADVVPTRLPVVRERDWLAGASVIETLPAAKGTRVTVRVYSPGDDSIGVEVAMADAQRRVIQPTRGSADAPRFASFEFTVTDSTGLPKMTFTPSVFGYRYWVMVTLTDAVTHQVVVLTPEPEETRF